MLRIVNSTFCERVFRQKRYSHGSPSYSPNLTVCDYFLFQQIKGQLQGFLKRGSVEDIQKTDAQGKDIDSWRLSALFQSMRTTYT